MNLSEMRTRVRQDLRDLDAADYRWSDAELDRHIEHGVRELSLAVPQEAKATLTSSAGSRELSIASLEDLVSIEAVEHPADEYPPVYAPFSVWGDTLTLLVNSAPIGEERVYVYYGKLHKLDANSSTIPSPLEELVAIGAEGYAALEWSSFATNRVNVGGAEVWRHYQAWGRERLDSFLKGLANHRSRLRTRHLYSAPQPGYSRAADLGRR